MFLYIKKTLLYVLFLQNRQKASVYPQGFKRKLGNIKKISKRHGSVLLLK